MIPDLSPLLDGVGEALGLLTDPARRAKVARRQAARKIKQASRLDRRARRARNRRTRSRLIDRGIQRRAEAQALLLFADDLTSAT